MFNYSHLKYPPLKLRPLPKYLIMRNYGKEKDGMRVYSTLSTKTGKICGHVICRPETVMRNKRRLRSMYVDELISYYPGNGSGTALLNFIKNLSKRTGCGGRFHLSASGCFTPQRVPHIFYRKYGMSTGNKYTDKRLDMFIKNGQDASTWDFNGVVMYYPPEAPEKVPPKAASGFLKKIFSNILDYLIEYSNRSGLFYV